MSISRTVTEVLREHVTLEVECIDRMYLNVYVPMLQCEAESRSFSAVTAATNSPLRL